MTFILGRAIFLLFDCSDDQASEKPVPIISQRDFTYIEYRPMAYINSVTSNTAVLISKSM